MIRDLVAEEREKATKENKLAVVVIGEFNDKANSIVVIHLKDLHPFCQAVKNGSVLTSMVPTTKRTIPVRSGTVVD